jgi:hypothetical protein
MIFQFEKKHNFSKPKNIYPATQKRQKIYPATQNDSKHNLELKKRPKI